MITAIDHVQIAIPPGQEARARAFYSGVLGLPETPKPEALAERGGCWFENANLKLHLGVDPNFIPARKAHVAFLVRDLDALQQRLTQAGCNVRPDNALDDVARFFSEDPFGNRLEFIQA